MLSGVDPYGTTIFNAGQMRAIIVEIENLLTADASSDAMGGLVDIMALCREGQRPPHRFLFFLGD